MLLGNPFFTENLMRDQPYQSMLLIAPNCDFTCKGCQNALLGNDSSYFEVEDVVYEYDKNPFFEGITVGGLELFLSGDDFLEDFASVVEISKTENVTIYTRFELVDSFVSGYLKRISEIPTVKNLYIKTGKYDEQLKSKTTSIGRWTMRLASSNQNFYTIKRSGITI